jgi:hypothetical protein
MGFNRRNGLSFPKISSEEKENNMPEMDLAAEEAAKELDPTWSAMELAQWWAKHYLKAGHKRLGRLIVDLSKKEVSL